MSYYHKIPSAVEDGSWNADQDIQEVPIETEPPEIEMQPPRDRMDSTLRSVYRRLGQISVVEEGQVVLEESQLDGQAVFDLSRDLKIVREVISNLHQGLDQSARENFIPLQVGAQVARTQVQAYANLLDVYEEGRAFVRDMEAGDYESAAAHAAEAAIRVPEMASHAEKTMQLIHQFSMQGLYMPVQVSFDAVAADSAVLSQLNPTLTLAFEGLEAWARSLNIGTVAAGEVVKSSSARSIYEKATYQLNIARGCMADTADCPRLFPKQIERCRANLELLEEAFEFAKSGLKQNENGNEEVAERLHANAKETARTLSLEFCSIASMVSA